MPQSLSKVILHLVFSTRNRHRVFLLEKMWTDTIRYMAGVLQNLDSPAIRIGVVTDHVHILHVLPRTRTIADIVGTVKRASSDWVKGQPWARGNADFAQFHWQKGYGSFSVSESQIPLVTRYIDGQSEHHRRVTFQEEYREFLEKHNAEFDERYVWD
jgi:putative transposase